MKQVPLFDYILYYLSSEGWSSLSEAMKIQSFFS